MSIFTSYRLLEVHKTKLNNDFRPPPPNVSFLSKIWMIYAITQIANFLKDPFA